jgi:DNA (cytosine-5)-methyltransferase 1
MNFGSFCTGIGAPEVAWSHLGWTPRFTSEIDPFACAVLDCRLPGVPNLGDVTRITTDAIPSDTLDLFVAGTPCQSFSQGGCRLGLDDPRGQLALTYLRLLRDLRGSRKPRWVVWENVTGAMSANDGRDFGTVLGLLGQLGYGYAYRVLDALNFGVAQRRRRVFIVGHLGDYRRAAAVLFDAEGGEGDSSPVVRKEMDAARGLRRGVGAAGCWWNGLDRTQTLDAVMAKKQCLPEKNRFPVVMVPTWQRCEACDDFWCNRHGSHTGDCDCPTLEELGFDPYEPSLLRYITPREAEALQGFEKDWTLVPFKGRVAPDTRRMKAVGNSMAVPVMFWIGKRIQMVDAL